MVLIKKLCKYFLVFAPSVGVRKFLLRRAGYIIGKYVYIAEGIIISDELRVKKNLIIEDRVSVAPRVTIITSSSPNYSQLIKHYPLVRGTVRIQKDAWLGAGVIIMPGVTIGEGAVIAAGAVVTEDIPPYTVAGGVPARIIKKLDNGI